MSQVLRGKAMVRESLLDRLVELIEAATQRGVGRRFHLFDRR